MLPCCLSCWRTVHAASSPSWIPTAAHRLAVTPGSQRWQQQRLRPALALSAAAVHRLVLPCPLSCSICCCLLPPISLLNVLQCCCHCRHECWQQWQQVKAHHSPVHCQQGPPVPRGGTGREVCWHAGVALAEVRQHSPAGRCMARAGRQQGHRASVSSGEAAAMGYINRAGVQTGISRVESPTDTLSHSSHSIVTQATHFHSSASPVGAHPVSDPQSLLQCAVALGTCVCLHARLKGGLMDAQRGTSTSCNKRITGPRVT
jgi:hypothetical protein